MMDDEEFEGMCDWFRSLEGRLERLERLCSSGSGAASGFADAERQGTDEAEGRSRESSAVSPGEAQALAELWEREAARLELEAEEFEEKGMIGAANVSSPMAATMRVCASTLRLTFKLPAAPKPDSGAPQERSGRRNSD